LRRGALEFGRPAERKEGAFPREPDDKLSEFRGAWVARIDFRGGAMPSAVILERRAVQPFARAFFFARARRMNVAIVGFDGGVHEGTAAGDEGLRVFFGRRLSIIFLGGWTEFRGLPLTPSRTTGDGFFFFPGVVEASLASCCLPGKNGG